jgi:hypothetical protein
MATAKRALDRMGSAHSTLPGNDQDWLDSVQFTCSCAFIRRHTFKIQNATEDVISIRHLAFLLNFDWDAIELLANDFGLKADRPFRELLETTER